MSNKTGKQIKHLLASNYMGIADKVRQMRKPSKQRKRHSNK